MRCRTLIRKPSPMTSCCGNWRCLLGHGASWGPPSRGSECRQKPRTGCSTSWSTPAWSTTSDSLAIGWSLRQARRHLSRSALRHELQTKGVAREFIDLALEDVDRDDELRAARALAGKKLGGLTNLPREVQQRRVVGALARRGFGSDIISRVLADLIGG